MLFESEEIVFFLLLFGFYFYLQLKNGVRLKSKLLCELTNGIDEEVLSERFLLSIRRRACSLFCNLCGLVLGKN